MTPGFWIILLTVLAYGLVHSLLASLQAKARARQWFGPASERWFRLAYNLVAGLTLLPVLLLPVLLPDHPLYRIPFPWLLINLTGQAFAVGMLLVGLRHTGVTDFLGLRKVLPNPETTPARLVTNGLYRYIRHPIYTAGMLFTWLIPVMSCNLLALNIGLTVYILIGANFEERKLRRVFGQEYGDYQAKTAMFIPGLKISTWLRLPRRR
jgi:protein-S-isoprenylcysteine O-methyltransferase Ste14